MASSIKRVTNLNRLNRQALRRASDDGDFTRSEIFESHWDELVIRFDPDTGGYRILTAREHDSLESLN